MKYTYQMLFASLFLGFSTFIQATPLTPVTQIKKYDSPIHNVAQSKDRESGVETQKSLKLSENNRLMSHLLTKSSPPTSTNKVNLFLKSLFS